MELRGLGKVTLTRAELMRHALSQAQESQARRGHPLADRWPRSCVDAAASSPLDEGSTDAPSGTELGPARQARDFEGEGGEIKEAAD
jgi:hypothetical protein